MAIATLSSFMVFVKRASYLLVCLLLKGSAIFGKEKVLDQVDHANRIRREFIQEMEKKYGWGCIGTGGRMPKQVETISVDFSLPRRATIEEARGLAVMATERFSEMVNADEKIRSHLCEFPFPPHRTQVGFSFHTPLGTRPTDGSVVSLSQYRNKIFYYSYDPLAKKHLTDLLEEPYPEAKKIVESSPNLNPLVHQEKPYESLIDEVFYGYLKEMFKKHHLECQSIGEKVRDGIIEGVVASLIYFHPTKIDKAQELQVVATEKLLEAINSHENLKPCLKNHPFSLNELKVSVLFREANYFCYEYDKKSLERVSQEGSEVTYFIEKEDPEDLIYPSPSVFAKESYPEAVEKIRSSPRSKKLNVKWQSQL